MAVRKFSLQYFYCSSLQDYDSQILEYCVLMFTLMISVCTTSIRKVMRRFVIREIVRGSFFRVFFLELQLEENRGGRNFCNINLSWEKKGVRHADLRSPKCAPPDRLYSPNLREYRERWVPRA